MVNLIRNENMKIYRRWRTWIMVAFIIAVVCTGSIIDWYYDDKTADEDAWRTEVSEDITRNEQTIASNTQLDSGYKEYLQEEIAKDKYHLEHNIHPTNGTMWDSINAVAELVLMITLMTVIIAGDSIASEFSTGTVKLLLIRPVSRFKILLSKYISMILFGILLLIILFVTSVLLNGILYQFENMNIPLLIVGEDGLVVERNIVANLWKTYLLNGISTIIFVSMAFMISAAFRSSAMAIGFSIFAMFAGVLVTQLVQRYEWSKYIVFANLDLTQHINGNPFQEGMTMSFSITVLVVYFIIFNVIAWTVFMRRDVAT